MCPWNRVRAHHTSGDEGEDAEEMLSWSAWHDAAMVCMA